MTIKTDLTADNPITNAEKQRNSTIDIIKGIGIFCMVGGHCNAPFSDFIYLFHMAIFFIASGYLYKEKYSENFSNLKTFLLRKCKSLYLPYVLWIGIFSALHNFFIKVNIYTNNPAITEYISGTYIGATHYYSLQEIFIRLIRTIFLFGDEQLAGAFWFISTLFKLAVMYSICDFIFLHLFSKKYKNILQLIISIIFLGIGYYCQLSGRTLLQFDKSFSCYILFFIGHMLNKKQLFIYSPKNIVHALSGTVSFLILIVMKNFGSIGLAANYYSNPVYLLIVSLAGWQFLYETAFFIDKTKVLKSVTMFWSIHSMSIVIGHFLSFKIISFLQVLIKQQPLFLIAAFPALYTDGFWWIAYTIVGLFIPCLLHVGYQNIRKFFIAKSKKIC